MAVICCGEPTVAREEGSARTTVQSYMRNMGLADQDLQHRGQSG